MTYPYHGEHSPALCGAFLYVIMYPEVLMQLLFKDREEAGAFLVIFQGCTTIQSMQDKLNEIYKPTGIHWIPVDSQVLTELLAIAMEARQN